MSAADTAQHSALKMRAYLAWTDRLLQCLAAPMVDRDDVSHGKAGRVSSVTTGPHETESVLLHVVTSFTPGSQSRLSLEPGTAAEGAKQMLGSSGASREVGAC